MVRMRFSFGMPPEMSAVVTHDSRIPYPRQLNRGALPQLPFLLFPVPLPVFALLLLLHVILVPPLLAPPPLRAAATAAVAVASMSLKDSVSVGRLKWAERFRHTAGQSTTHSQQNARTCAGVACWFWLPSTTCLFLEIAGHLQEPMAHHEST